MQVGPIRCLADGLAVADGKWELRGITDANGKFLPSLRGLFAMVVERSDSTWRIVAYRYTLDPTGPTVPTLLKRPGYPEGLTSAERADGMGNGHDDHDDHDDNQIAT